MIRIINVKKFLFAGYLVCLFYIVISYANITPTFSAKIEETNSLHIATSRKLTFSGYNWTVRTSNQQQQGPGPNYFSDSYDTVWVDNNGFLHLKLKFENNKWYCAEIYSDDSFGYGSYTFRLSPGFEDLDINVVVGLFTYLDDENEIDIEFARWGQKDALNGQYVVQPYSNEGNLHLFDMPATGEKSVHSFTWCPNYIRYWSTYGSSMSYSSDRLISEWYYTGTDNPSPSTERVHINLWLMSGLAPTDGLEAEIIIEEFIFTANECNDPIPLPPWIIIIIISTAVACISIVFLIKRMKTSSRH